MTVALTGSDLDIAQTCAVARDGEPVSLDPDAASRMLAARRVVDDAVARGDEVYGLTTGVGVLKRVRVDGDERRLEAYNRALVESHRVAQGPAAPPDVSRATMLVLANTLARGTAGVRPVIVERLIELLNAGRAPSIRTLGSLGQADLASMADLALAAFGDMAFAPGEGLALLNNNAFSAGWSALAVADALRIVDAMEVSGALALEAFEANLTPLHAAAARARPYRGHARSRDRIAGLLEGSRLWDAGRARNLQDPLSFRNVAHVLGAAHDALEFAREQVVVELNAGQGNPLVVTEENRVISVANYDALPLAAAIDFARIGLAPAVWAAAERSVKLLETPWSGLPTGLVPKAGTPASGLSMFGIAVQAIAAEARLLALPVSFEVTSTSHAEGLEDRTTMAPLGARRLGETVELAERVVAIELLLAAQALDVRGSDRVGRGAAAARAAVREVVPSLREEDSGTPDLDPVVALIREGRLSRS